MTTSTSKIEPHHLRLQAVVYIRQSTPQQIQNNQESTRRQYDLACRARQMGWPETAVRVIDDDLGLSGTGSRNRAGFQRLVAAIGLGEVGIILVTEVSRLSRLSSDWHRVIELCAVFRTLIADEDGIYDAQSPNDRLLLGVKGTLFAAELHILQARMRGALLSKARRGELAVTLPVGYRRRPDGAVVQDPDEAVRLAVATVFERFGALGNARAVLRHLAGSDLAFPRLVQAGPEMGRIAWVRPTYGMIHRMLVNPTYAGAFVYGRCRQEVSAGDPPTVAERRLPPEEWAIVVQGVYPGYISYDTFLANRRQLHGNRYNFEAKGRGAPREGTALLQGLVRCGRCGQQMGISYGRQRPRYQCRRAQTDLALAGCQSFLAGEIDARVVMAFLDAVRPAGLEATLAALRDLEEERHAVERQWQLRLERARYEARLARRQYDTVDPDNRLVARELERRWEAALAEVERLEQDHERMRRTELRPLEPADIADVRRLAADLPALWHADTTLPADRKRLLRLVIAAVTVTVAGDRRAAEVVILWSGGATTRHHVVGRPFGWHLRTEAEMLGLIRELAEKMPDHQVAAALAGLGLCTRHRKSWTRARVASMRRQHGIPTACPTQTGHQTCRADGLVPARVAGERLGMTLAAIRVWAHRGILPCDQSSPSAKLWVRLTPEDIERVSGEADVAGMPRVREVAAREGVASADVWARVSSGELVAYRAPRGRDQWEWRLTQHALPNATPSASALLPLRSERTA